MLLCGHLCAETGIALLVPDRAAHQRCAQTEMGGLRDCARYGLLHPNPHAEDADRGRTARESGGHRPLRRAVKRHGIQRAYTQYDKLSFEKVDCGGRYQEEYHLPLFPPHLRHAANRIGYGHLYGLEDADSQERNHYPDLRRLGQR